MRILRKLVALSNDGGNISIMFAASLIVIITLGGVAIDTAVAVHRGRIVNQATDASLLAAANAAINAKQAGRADWKEEGLKAANSMFRANLPEWFSAQDVIFTPDIKVDGDKIVATASYRAKSSTTLMRVVGFDHVNVGGSASAGVSSGSPIDVHFVIDNSTSMGIGADVDSQNIMLARANCALACHFKWPGQITSAQSHAAGATLRIDVVRDATIAAMQSLKQKAGGSSDALRVSLSTFSASLKQLHALTSDVDAVMAKARNIDLDDSNYGGGTMLTAALSKLSETLPRGGDGTSNNDRKSFIVIFSDAIDDSNRMYQIPFSITIDKYRVLRRSGADRDWWDTSPAMNDKGDYMQAFDPQFCTVLKTAKNQTVMFIQMKYVTAVGLASDYRVVFIKNQLEVPIAQAVNSCVSKADYKVLASGTEDIAPAFQKMVGEIAKARGLSLTQ